MASLKARDAVLIDTNILIDYLDGYIEARELLKAVKAPAISIVTWMEVLVGARNSDEEIQFKQFFESWRIVPLEPDIAERAVTIRRERRLKLPDAIILASAQHEHRKLVTRNNKDFRAEDPDIVVPYQLKKPRTKETGQ